MSQRVRISGYIGAIGAAAILVVVASWHSRQPWPGFLGPTVFALISFLLDVSSITLRSGEGRGSIAFVTQIASGVLFGPFWGALVVITSTGLAQLVRRPPIERLVFNIFQRTLILVICVWAYQFLGGEVPPTYLLPGSATPLNEVLASLLAFLGGALVYISVNSLLVSGAVALSTGQSFLLVWRTNTLWILGYDIVAASLSLIVSFLYLSSDRQEGVARLSFVVVFLLAILMRHIYGKLSVLRTLYDELDQAHEKLELNLREQLAMMVKSIEARDPYTSGHSRRVSILARTIALDLGLSEADVEEIENAALLHDVGKIHAEFAPLLQKEGRLTQDEWDLMKTHATKGAELVGLFTRFRGNVENAVRHHHERWDGKGYPDGINDVGIPLGARIIMISDTIDAMTTDRPYRKALPFEAVVAELLKYRGAQFDPELVDMVVRSVTIRRLVADPEMLSGYRKGAAGHASNQGPLRSQGSFWEGVLSEHQLKP